MILKENQQNEGRSTTNAEQVAQKVDKLNSGAWLLRYEDPGKALEMAKNATRISRENNYRKGIAYGTLMQGVCLYLHSLNEEVIHLLVDAREQFEALENGQKGLSVAFNFLAMVHESYGDYETAIKYAQEAIGLAENAGYREGEGDALATLGQINLRLSDFQQALASFKKSLDTRNELEDHKAVSSSLNLIARTYTLMKEYGNAEEYYRQSLKLREEINDRNGLPWTYLGLASLFEEMKEHNKSIEYYNRSIELNRSIGETRSELQCLLGLARIHIATGELEKAKDYLNRSMKIAADMKAKPMIYRVHRIMADYYEAKGELAEALHHLKEFQRIEKEVNNAESHSRMRNQQIMFATEQSRKEAEIYQLRNVELKAAYDEIEEKNNEITDSIRYAEKLQRAVLPPQEYLDELLPDYFMLYLPKDIVSGDYYWATKKNDLLVFTAADCTGHGIPGAFMSMLGVSFLNEIVSRRRNLDAAKILDELRKKVIASLHQSGEEGTAKDGMDMGLCVYDPSSFTLQYAGAYNPMYLIREGELLEYRADRMPVAIHHNVGMPFTNNEIKIKQNDIIYLFSDGYADQFGGPEGKKFKYKQLKDLLFNLHKQPMDHQKDALFKRFQEWKGDEAQVDDVILMGIRF
ncbi:MAG: tetratricopeptide repeat protein [Bacteroidales bacterium]|nr:tetratricopeptide repeat protein [Bacteroidales bacterium]